MSFITANQDPTKLPNQSMEQDDFDLAYADMIAQYPAMGGQMNALAANMSAYAAGGAYSFMYAFDTSTTAGDPGPGKLRFNAAGQSSAGAIYIDPVTVGGGNIDSLLVSIGANLSLLKGSIRLVKAADPTRWMLFDISDLVAGSGYRALAVTFRASSSATPFSNGDALQVFLDRTGDRAIDLSPMARLGGGTVYAPTGALSIDYLNIFSDSYYRYQIELTDFRALSAATASLIMRMAVGGVVNSSASYADLTSSGGGTTSRATGFSVATVGSTGGRGFTIDVRNARGVSRTGVGVRGSDATANMYSRVSEGFFDASTAVSGFRLFILTGEALAGQIDIYGFRKEV